MLTNEELQGGFNLGEWQVLPAHGTLRRGDEEVRPEPKVLAVLLALARRDGNLVTKDELIEEVWEGRAFGDEPIQRCIALLRKHFHDTKPFQYIETLQRRGYRLLKPVELHVAADVASEPDVDQGRSVNLWRAVAAIIAIGFVAIAALNWIPRDEPAVRSLAILPFQNLSGDPANQYIVDGVKNVLAQRLTGLSEFTIKNVRSVHTGEPSEIATQLGVESVLTGSLQLQNGALRVGYEIIRGSDGVSMLAGEEAGALDELFGLQERLANAVRDELAGSQTPQLITLREPDSAAYNSYMRGMHALEHRFERDNLEESIRLFQESIRLDESYGPAYLGLATAYALLPDYRDAAWEEHLDLAIDTVEKGIRLDPSIEDPAGAIYGFVYYQEKQWTKAEENYRRAVGAPVVDSNAFSWFSQMLASVGRMEESRDMALAGEVIDPDSTVVNSRIAMVYTWMNNTAKAHEYFTRANALDATGIIHDMAYALLLLRSGQGELSQSVAYEAATIIGSSTDWIGPVFRGLADPALAPQGLAAINAAWEAGDVIPHIVLLARTLFRDIDGAMEIAWKLQEPGETFSMEILFIRELEPLRQHPDFMPLLESLGVVDHWADAGCEWANDRLFCER